MPITTSSSGKHLNLMQEDFFFPSNITEIQLSLMQANNAA